MDKLPFLKIKDILSNKNIFQLAMLILFALIYIIFVFSANMGSSTHRQREFSLTTIQEQEYAVIYVSGNTYYLNEAASNQDSLTINRAKQRIVTSNDLAYETMEFAEVIVLPEEKDR